MIPVIHFILEICGILFLFILLISFAGHKADEAEIRDTRKILENQYLIINQNLEIMATIEEVQQAVTDLQASVDAKQAAIATAIAALEAQVAAGSAATPEQLQAVIDSLKATQADVESTPTA